METHLPREIREGLAEARRTAQMQASRLRLQVGTASFPILRAWEGGFAIDAGRTPPRRGRVVLYDGARLMSHCLIIASEEEGGEIRFEYKRMTEAAERQPLDFYQESPTPIALPKPGDAH